MEEQAKNVSTGHSAGSVSDNSPLKTSRGFSDVLSLLLVVVIAFSVALLLTAYIFQSYQVDGPSMEPTLQNSNRLIVWKLPRTLAHITGHAYIPDRGDIVIFNTNGLPDFGEDGKQLIKRVVALPGEQVVIKNGTLNVYNKQHPQGFSPDATLPYGKAITSTQGDESITVPKNSIFVCGDNRGDSLDSRIFGPVPTTNIVGKLVFRVLPINELEGF
ncbi:MAG TPA: signal peptidase I [Candidatus Saccharimonadales bacterium]|nr:signal peptidase I [Candidatus Saccharimonadales bacterium]